MQHKFTPGPWYISESSREYNGQLMVLSKHGDNGTHVCEVTTDTKRNKPNISAEQESNARLIAAAPELLAALKASIECGMVPESSAEDGGASKYARHVEVADMIRAAVAKAQGGAA